MPQQCRELWWQKWQVSRPTIYNENVQSASDVNKDLTCKAKAKAKDLSIKAKAKAKDLIYKAKAKAKDLTIKAKAKAKDLTFNAKSSTYVARQQYWSLCFLPRFISILWIVCCA